MPVMPENEQAGQHPALGRAPGTLLGAPLGNLVDVVGELSLEKFLGFIAVHRNECKMLQIEYGITGQGRSCFRVRVAEVHDT